MKVNKELMARARAKKQFEASTISSLTVSEFRKLMQECFDADRAELNRRKREDDERKHKARIGVYP